MLQLYFYGPGFPRTITRDEWKDIWRWKRVTQKTLAKELQERMNNLAVYGTTHPEIYERIINPPITMHDKQG